MYNYYFTFQSVSRAQQAVFSLARKGIQSDFIKTPKAVSYMGCGYAIKVSQTILYPTLQILRNENIKFEHLVRLRQDDTIEEVLT